MDCSIARDGDYSVLVKGQSGNREVLGEARPWTACYIRIDNTYV